MADTDYEEVDFVCENCGKKVRMVKLSSLNVDDMLCQRCALELSGTEGLGGDD